MATQVTVNGQVFNIPSVGERGWGQEVSSLLNALATGLLQRSGGVFPLTNNVDFGTAHGLLVAWLQSKATNPASSGFLRLSNGDVVSWRNHDNSGNVDLAYHHDTDFNFDILKYAGKDLINEDSQQYLRNKIFGQKDTVAIDPSAVFEARSTTQGSAPYPRMTESQRNAIVSPMQGLTVYNTTANRIDFWNGTAWVSPGVVNDAPVWDEVAVSPSARSVEDRFMRKDGGNETVLGNKTFSDDILGADIQATSSSGLHLKNQGGSDCFTVGAGGGVNATSLGALSMNSQKIVNMADGTAATDGATYGQVSAITTPSWVTTGSMFGVTGLSPPSVGTWLFLVFSSDFFTANGVPSVGAASCGGVVAPSTNVVLVPSSSGQPYILVGFKLVV
jgi:hypothetical protein